ncbi:extracellular solute-binding protein [Candidatus Uabimicrobium amorphum]|uniref:extracellular solute-binding protein n=1 Tax=Uabimicrobium amorphum TaxID=2596890 RepID=UPI0015675127|nr:extracellular solute-binding protein [Candidatus Uabimicrobium amorphum]
MKRILLFTSLLIICACNDTTPKPQVVVYTALDRMFSEPILKKFEQQTGIEVRAKYDNESTKSVGLTACIIEESLRPRCDVFWNNEIINTLRLKKRGLLAPFSPPQAKNIAKTYKDPQNYWTGFAARARVILVNTDKVKPRDYPNSLWDFTDEKWRGKFGIAKPVAGTTATHIACLFALLGAEKTQKLLQQLKKNQVSIESGNKQCARKVAEGELWAALTDTDDAMIEINDNKPVAMVYLDTKGMGTLFIPNTLALIAKAPHPQSAKKLIDFLLSPQVEELLAKGPSAQIPLNSKTKTPARVKTPLQIKGMKVDFAEAASSWEEARNYVTKFFLP